MQGFAVQGFRVCGFPGWVLWLLATIFGFPSLFHIMSSGVGFAILVSGPATKYFMISRFVLCLGFGIAISLVSF